MSKIKNPRRRTNHYICLFNRGRPQVVAYQAMTGEFVSSVEPAIWWITMETIMTRLRDVARGKAMAQKNWVVRVLVEDVDR